MGRTFGHMGISAAFGSAGDPAGESLASMSRVIFEPFRARNLTVKNRIFRSSISGLFDNYDGSGTDVRIAWDVRFARLGAGAIISSNSPVHPRGRLAPGYAQIDSDGRVPFWSELGKRIHEHDCKYILHSPTPGGTAISPGSSGRRG